MSFGGSLLAPDVLSLISLRVLRQARKWTAFPAVQVADAGGHDVTLGDLFAIKRGIATGANGFFIMAEEEAIRLGIPEDCRRPILPNPRNLETEIIEPDLRGYPANIARLSLLDCDLPEDEVEARFPRFSEYLQRGKANEVHLSYLASRRNPWYSQEKRDPAPFLFTYMGRATNGQNPFRVIWNKSAATAHNVYLLLYPRPALRRLLDQDPDLHRVVFDQLRSIDAGRLQGQGRVYGGGLHKIEPKELARVPAVSLWKAVAGSASRPPAMKSDQLSLAL